MVVVLHLALSCSAVKLWIGGGRALVLLSRVVKINVTPRKGKPHLYCSACVIDKLIQDENQKIFDDIQSTDLLRLKLADLWTGDRTEYIVQYLCRKGLLTRAEGGR